MGLGHIVDANTFALWRFDETTHQDYSSAAEENGNYDASQTTAATKPGITGGPALGNDRARWFSGAQGMDFTPDGTFITAMQGDWTWEAWIYVHEFTSTDTWFDVGFPSGETAATDFLARIQLTASGFLQIFWEHSGGVNVTVTQGTGTAVSLHAWTYVAITASVSGATRTVNFFVNSGTSQDSGSGTNNTDGSSDVGAIGFQVDGTASVTGAIARMRVSSVVRTGTELNNNATDTTNYAFSNDGSTLALWNFQEPPEISDISGNAYHLTSTGKSVDQPFIVESLLRTDGGQARQFTTVTNSKYVAYYREEIRTLLLGEYTVEWWGVLNGSGDHGICQWGQGGTSEPNNYLISLGFEPSAGNYVCDLLWEEGAGVNVTATGTAAIVSDNTEGALNRDAVHHYAVVFQDVTGTTRNVLVYRDATLVETIGPLTKPTGGTNPGATNDGLEIGDGFNAGPWQGFMDDMRISNKVRTLSEIQASYNRGAQMFSRGLPALPRQLP